MAWQSPKMTGHCHMAGIPIQHKCHDSGAHHGRRNSKEAVAILLDGTHGWAGPATKMKMEKKDGSQCMGPYLVGPKFEWKIWNAY
jgi:hypothetical protein